MSLKNPDFAIDFPNQGELVWPIFQDNRHFLNGLPAIGASAIQRLVRHKHDVQLSLIVVSQTFGGLLNFNCHLHMLVSAGGSQESEHRRISLLHFHKDELMRMCRRAVSSYIWVASRLGAVRSTLSSEEFEEILTSSTSEIRSFTSAPLCRRQSSCATRQRYIRRPPLPQIRVGRMAPIP